MGHDAPATGGGSLLLVSKQVAAGGCAGAITKTSVAPLERVKIIMQVRGMKAGASAPAAGGLGGTMKHVIKEEGVLSLWRSNGVNWCAVRGHRDSRQ